MPTNLRSSYARTGLPATILSLQGKGGPLTLIPGHAALLASVRDTITIAMMSGSSSLFPAILGGVVVRGEAEVWAGNR